MQIKLQTASEKKNSTYRAAHIIRDTEDSEDPENSADPEDRKQRQTGLMRD